ncbi:MAG: hypothetical protein JW720_11390 [Sedimentisphaerales bacterium]|nr:hypothetical protein [Sedimentisphaerales bacterium]
MSTARNVKILTWLQLCTVIGVVIGARFYVKPHSLRASTRGMIDGILFCPDRSSALIDGQVLKVGDEIYGVEVVEIEKRIVIFEKNGKRWEQRVREYPNSAWDESDPPGEPDSNDLPDPATSTGNPPAARQAFP